MTTTVLGLGHPAAGDDAVGLWVARALARDGIAAREAGDATLLLSLLEEGQRVIVVDAVVTAAGGGEVVHLRPDALARAGVTPLSCHGVSFAQALELAQLLYPDAGARIDIVAIPIARPTRVSDQLSARAAAQIAAGCALVRRLLAEESLATGGG